MAVACGVFDDLAGQADNWGGVGRAHGGGGRSGTIGLDALVTFVPLVRRFNMGKRDSVLPTGQSLYQVVGRFVPNAKYGESDPQCKVYRMKIFAKNKVVARSRFWYFIGRLCRVKKANGQIISVNQVRPSAAPLDDGPALRGRLLRCGHRALRVASSTPAALPRLRWALLARLAHAAGQPLRMRIPSRPAAWPAVLAAHDRARAHASADLREGAGAGQEHWHLVPVRLADWHAQRLQGVPRGLADERRQLAVPEHGWSQPR